MREISEIENDSSPLKWVVLTSSVEDSSECRLGGLVPRECVKGGGRDALNGV